VTLPQAPNDGSLRLRPTESSLRLRFAVAMLAWIGAGLLVIGISTSALFRRHVEAQFHDELKVHLVELAELTRFEADGRPVLDRPLSDPRYGMPDSGFYWQVEREGAPVLKSASMTRGALDPALAHQPEIVHRLAKGPTGPTMTYGFARPAPDGGSELHFLIATDERILNEVISAFDRELQRWLTLLAAGLLATGVIVNIYTLRPLDRLGKSVAAVRNGSARRMDVGWPAEIAPLVADLNDLLDTNEAMVTRARVEAGNLAHSLRTSLAILTDEAETLAKGKTGDSAATLLEQCRRIERQLDWHLARARASVRHGATTPLPDAILPIASAMQRLHAERGIGFSVRGTDPLLLAIEPEDFAEIVSNLSDNAGKWAHSRVRIDCSATDAQAQILVTDDGPGIPEQMRASVFGIGNRLDERSPGHGLGLAIAQDLARHYGGEVVLTDRDDGADGLVAQLWLPLVPRHETGTEADNVP
jgi:signal transduction histidine kinase